MSNHHTINDPQKSKNRDTSKESFFVFVSKVAGITATICAVVLLFGEATPAIEHLAKQGFSLAAMVWIVFAAIPMMLRNIWYNRQRIWSQLKTWLKRSKTQASTLQVVREPNEDHYPEEQAEHSSAMEVKRVGTGFETLQMPYDLLDSNPNPRPKSELQADMVGQIIGDALQLVGLKLESEIEVLAVESGPTLQTVSFRLPPRIQLSQLISKSDDLANHIGHHLGFDVTAAPNFKSAAAFVIPHKKRAYVYMRDMAAELIQSSKQMALPIMLGRDVLGQSLIYDLPKMPHLLVAGATGSGKSVCVNTIINSILICRSPEQVKFVLIDPKQVELSVYNGMPHLLAPPITDPKRAVVALRKVIVEMEKRYERFKEAGVRNIGAYNRSQPDTMPYIVVVVDEYADLMMVYGAEVEDLIQRIVQMARAAGIHLILSTQRPSTDVVTGVIKANLPSRIAFKLESHHDYRTVLDGSAPPLLGFGDGLCRVQGGPKIRFQSAASSINDDEATALIQKLRNYWIEEGRRLSKPGESSSEYAIDLQDEDDDEADEVIFREPSRPQPPPWEEDELDADDSELTEEEKWYRLAVRLAHQHQGISCGLVQRNLRISYTAAAKLIERMEQEGIVGGLNTDKGMRLLITNDTPTPHDELLNRMKIHICKTRSTNSTELRDMLGVRKELVLQLMGELVDEDFLHPPTSTKIGYTLAWRDDEIDSFLEAIIEA